MPNSGDKFLASDINSLFNRLEQIRVAHNNSYQSSSVQQELGTAFNTAPAVVGAAAKADETIPLMKQYLNTLRKSVFLTAVTEEQVNQIEVPKVGDLLKYQEFGEADQLIALIETYPSSYTTNFSGFNGNNFTNFAFNGSNFTNFAFNGSDFFNFAFNGSDFTNFNFSSSPTTPHTNQRFDGRFFNN